MAKYKVAINGFGRIGRVALRAFFENNGRNNEFDVVAINSSPRPIETLAYLFKYDSVFRRFNGDVEVADGNIIINGNKIKVLAEKDPSTLPWKDLGIDVVIESSGKFKDGPAAQSHINAGAKKVVITSPAKKHDATIVMGVNENIYDPAKHHIISNASCTTTCLAPLCKVLQDKFGIKEGLMNTIHSYTSDQRILDGSHKKLSRGRAAAMSIVPTDTGAAKAISQVIPELEGKLKGFALRVPTPDVSAVDLTVVLEKATNVDEINAAMKEASETYLKGYLGYETDDLVSMDFVGDERSSIFAPAHTLGVGDHMFKLLAWYDNEYGYSCRVLDLVSYILNKGL